MTEDATTKPTLETVLERINALDRKTEERINALEQKVEGRIDRLDNRMNGLDTRMIGLDMRMGGVENQVNGLRSDLVNIRSDTNAGLRQVVRKIEALNDNVLAVQAAQRDLILRVENLESQDS